MMEADGTDAGRRARHRPAALAGLRAVARHEWRRIVVVTDRRALLVGAALVVLLAVAWPAAQERGVSTQDGIFPVSVADGSPLRPAIEADDRFRIVAATPDAVAAGKAALHVGATADDIVVAPDARGAAALHALEVATAIWVEGRMAFEADKEAAYPVRVTLIEPAAATPGAEPGPAEGPGDGGADGPGQGGSTTGSASEVLAQDVGAQPQPGLQPGELDPPFPVRSLLLTFAYLIPMNFIAQLQAGSLHAERTRHRATLLLSAPVPHWHALAGRVVPYLALSLGVWVAASLLAGVGPAGYAAALVIVLFVLAGACVIGLLARSEREVTFLLTGLTTAFSTFLFLPAVFTSLPPVAFLSPVAVVAASAEGSAVGWGAFLYALVPTALCTVALAALCVGLFSEQTLFSRRGLVAKVGEALQRLVRSRVRLLVAGVLLVPFALALELFVLGLVIPLGLGVVFPAVVLGAAAVEEGLKRMATRAHRARTQASPWTSGILVGIGFFLGEKIALLVALVGFGFLPLGQASLAIFGVGTTALLLAPLLVHTVCAAVGAHGRTTMAGRYAWFAAFALHAGYNTAVALVGGGVL